MLVTNVAILFQRLVDDVLKPCRNIRIQPDCRGWRSVEDGFEDHSRGIATKRRRARCHLIEHHPE